jgi:hypothetical protein
VQEVGCKQAKKATEHQKGSEVEMGALHAIMDVGFEGEWALADMFWPASIRLAASLR